MFKPLKKTSIAYRIIEHFIQMVQEGKIKAGDRLPSERSMAEAFAVSRSSLRTALQILSSNKVIDIRPGNGIFLLQPAPPFTLEEDENSVDSDDPIAFVQTLEIRLLVEPRAARLAAKHITKIEAEELSAINKRAERMLDEDSFNGFAIEDMNFHFTYPRATRNKILTRLIRQYCVTTYHHLVIFGQIPGIEKDSLEQHKELVVAFRAHDPERAEDLMRNHIYYAMRKNLGNTHNVVSWERLNLIDAYRETEPFPDI